MVSDEGLGDLADGRRLLMATFVASDGHSCSSTTRATGTGGSAPSTAARRRSPAGGGAARDIVPADLRGSLRAGIAGCYFFRSSSDDGSFLWRQDELMADNSGDRGTRSVESDTVWLDNGVWYPIRVRWYNAGGGGNLCLEWRIPRDAGFTAVPAANFTPDA